MCMQVSIQRDLRSNPGFSTSVLCDLAPTPFSPYLQNVNTYQLLCFGVAGRLKRLKMYWVSKQGLYMTSALEVTAVLAFQGT